MISALEAAAIHAQLREIMRQKYVGGRAALRATLNLQHEDSSRSGPATQADDVIDLTTRSGSSKTPTYRWIQCFHS